jgi:hypothetical protein
MTIKTEKMVLTNAELSIKIADNTYIFLFC